MVVELALSARDVVKAKIWRVAAVSVLRVLPLCAKKSKVFKKGMLSLDLSGSGLDLVWTKSGLRGDGEQGTGNS